MENASKALIIAGAILLSILIIGLGMTIYQKASGAMDGADLGGQQVQVYNAEFENYKGTQTGANVRALVQVIQSHNRTKADDTTLQISVSLENGGQQTNTPTDKSSTVEEPESSVSSVAVSKIKAGWNYDVQFTYSKAGYITHCYITALK